MNLPERAISFLVPWPPAAAAGQGEAATDKVLHALGRKEAAWYVSRSRSWQKWLSSVLDCEIDQLPLRVKASLVYCDLGRHRIEDAAEMLDWSPRRVRRCLTRGRRHLCARLRRQGIRVSTATLRRVLRRHASVAEQPEDALAQTVQLATRSADTEAGLPSQLARLAERALCLLGC
jgi:hypothetical protein